MHSRSVLPPTPPMQLELSYERRQSPSAVSTSARSVSSMTNQSFHPHGLVSSSFNNLEPHTQRQIGHAAPRRESAPQSSSNYGQSPYISTPQYSPSSQSVSSFYSASMHSTPSQSNTLQGMYYQRPLPQVSEVLNANFEAL